MFHVQWTCFTVLSGLPRFIRATTHPGYNVTSVTHPGYNASGLQRNERHVNRQVKVYAN